MIKRLFTKTTLLLATFLISHIAYSAGSQVAYITVNASASTGCSAITFSSTGPMMNFGLIYPGSTNLASTILNFSCSGDTAYTITATSTNTDGVGDRLLCLNGCSNASLQYRVVLPTNFPGTACPTTYNSGVALPNGVASTPVSVTSTNAQSVALCGQLSVPAGSTLSEGMYSDMLTITVSWT